MISCFNLRIRFLMSGWLLFAGCDCYGMQGLCVATRTIQKPNLLVSIPQRQLSPGGSQSLLRHLEPETIADMWLCGKVLEDQLRRLPPQDRERVDACVKAHLVWSGPLDVKMLSEREQPLVNNYLKKLIVEKVDVCANKEQRQLLLDEIKEKPEWLRLMFARCFFLRHQGKDIGKQVGLTSIGTFKTEKLVRAGILDNDWSAHRPEELPCKEYMADFKHDSVAK